MKAEQVTKPLQSQTESYVVDSGENKYQVQRIRTGICPGGHLDQIQNAGIETEPVMECCTTYDIVSICQHIFSCECADYVKSNDCKHILMGNLNCDYVVNSEMYAVTLVMGNWNPATINVGDTEPRILQLQPETRKKQKFDDRFNCESRAKSI